MNRPLHHLKSIEIPAIPSKTSMLSGIPALWNHPLFWGGVDIPEMWRFHQISSTPGRDPSSQPRLWVMCHVSELLQVRSHLLKCMGGTYYSQPPWEDIPFQRHFWEDDVPFPVWVGYVSSKEGFPHVTPLRRCERFITKFPFSKCTSFRKWAMDRSCSRTGTSWHCTSISCWDKECLKPNNSPKRLAPLTRRHQPLKSFKNSKDFPKDRIFQTSGARWPQPNDFTKVLRLTNLPQVARMVFL